MIGRPGGTGLHVTAASSHAHRLPHGHLAAGRRWTRDARAGVLAVPRRARPRGRRRHDGRRRAGGAGRARWSSSRARRRFPVRYGRLARVAARRARSADVVYATATYAAASFASSVSRTPLVGEARLRPGLRARAPLRALRRDARGVPAAGLGAGRGAEAGSDAGAAPRRGDRRPERLPRGDRRAAGASTARASPCCRTRRRTSTSSPCALEPGTFVFVGRLTRAEGTRGRDRGDRARARARGSIVIGDGPDRDAARSGSRATPAPPDRIDVPRVAASRRGARGRGRLGGGAADERLGELPALGRRGTRRRRAGSLDGRGRRARDRAATGSTGSSCRPAMSTRVAAAMTQRSCARPGSATGSQRLRGHRSPQLSVARVYGRLEAVLERGRAWLIATRASSSSDEADTGSRSPAWLAKKWDAIEELIDYRVLGAAEPARRPRSERFRLRAPARPRALDGALFYLRLPFRIRRQIDEFEPDVDRRRRPVRRGGGAARPPAGARHAAADRRGARRLAHVHARSTARPPRRFALAVDRSHQHVRPAARRRDARRSRRSRRG